MVGGYVIVDAVGVNFAADTASKVTGLHKQLYSAMDSNKPVVLYNVLSGDDGLYSPLMAGCSIAGATITVHTGIKSFMVAADDTVTII